MIEIRRIAKARKMMGKKTGAVYGVFQDGTQVGHIFNPHAHLMQAAWQVLEIMEGEARPVASYIDTLEQAKVWAHAHFGDE